MSNQPTIIDGKKVAQCIQDDVARRVKAIVAKTGVVPCLATVLVGEDPASATYVRRKGLLCESLGMRSLKVVMPATTTTKELVDKITQLSNDKSVHGILLQHPVPKQIDERAAFEAIAPIKDVDGVTFYSFGTMFYNLPGYASCTPEGMMRLLKAYNVAIAGKQAVVIGRSAILGKPLAGLLLAADATVTICHSKTKNLPEVVRQADIVCAAVGKPNFVKGEWIKPGAVVLDAGFNPSPKGNVGDVDYESAFKVAGMITPVPGGVGPMTLAVLMDQTCIGAAKLLGVEV